MHLHVLYVASVRFSLCPLIASGAAASLETFAWHVLQSASIYFPRAVRFTSHLAIPSVHAVIV